MTTNYDVRNSSLKISHAFIILFPIFSTILGVGYSYAENVDRNTKDISEVKKDIDDLVEMKKDINKLNITTATLKNEIGHVKSSQKRTEEQLEKTNLLLKELLLKNTQPVVPVQPSNPSNPYYQPRDPRW